MDTTLSTLTHTHTLEPVVVGSTSLSLEELKELKKLWLESAEREGYIESLITIAKACGTEFIPERWVNWTGWEWKAGDITVTVLEGPGLYLPYMHRFNQIRSLMVKKGADRLVYYRTADVLDEKPDCFFVMGDWVARLMDQRPAALKILNDRKAEKKEAERQALIRQLLVGKKVV